MIDTREAYNRLIAANLPADQADVLVALLREVERPDTTVLATKTDLADLKAELYRAMLGQTVVLLGVMVALKLFA